MTDTPGDEARRTRSRNGKGRFIRSIDTVDRDRRAAELITQGWTYEQVADHLGYSDKGTCHRAVQQALREAARLDGTSEQIRQRQLLQLAEQRRLLWAMLLDPPVAISRTGKIVTDEHGKPLADAQAIAATHALLIKISEREARIRGTDAPRRSITLTGHPGPEEILAFLESVNPEDLSAAVATRRRQIQDAEREANAITGTLEAS